MPKQARLNRIKVYCCYTIEEAAEICGVTQRTIRNWMSLGLRAMADGRPALIRGDDLSDFIKVVARGPRDFPLRDHRDGRPNFSPNERLGRRFQ